jgi:hypothetical protein
VTTAEPRGRRLRRALADPRAALAVYLLLAAGAALQAWLAPNAKVGWSNYNNFEIFRDAFHRLVRGEGLYALRPGGPADLFKYSPTFALLFAPYALLPMLPAMIAWNATNAAVLWLGLARFPFPTARGRTAALWLCALEQWGAHQHFQTNALIAGLVLLAFGWLERGARLRAAAAVLLTVFTKLFGAVAFALYAFQRRRLRLALATAAIAAALAALPLVAVGPARLARHYAEWLALLRADHGASLGYSVMGVLHAWLGWDPPKGAVLAAGALAMALPFALRRDRHGEPAFRARVLAALLLWVVIFNHKAEGPTFVIAMAGVAVWWGVEERRGALDVALLALAFVFVSLAPTEVFPRAFRTGVVPRYAVKALPCIAVWLRCLAELLGPARVMSVPGGNIAGA